MTELFFTNQSQNLLATFLKEVDITNLSNELSLYEECHGKTNEQAIEVCFSRVTKLNHCPTIITDDTWSKIKNYNFSDRAVHADSPEQRQLLVTLL